MREEPAIRSTSERGLLNDVHQGLGQQMFFWGRDVLNAGNLLRAHGFDRRPSPGHQGTSCYCRDWCGGVIELHGHCAGWYPAKPGEIPGFLFVRTHRRSYAHHQPVPVIPGCYASHREGLSTGVHLAAARHFSAWLTEYEGWIIARMGTDYRDACHAMFGKLSTSRPWLSPSVALKWWHELSISAPSHARARHFKVAADC